MSKEETTDQKATSGSKPKSTPANSSAKLRVRILKTGTVVNRLRRPKGAVVTDVAANQARALEEAKLAEIVGV